jgi:7-alpha-hydroxysteroid dehydrogenase
MTAESLLAGRVAIVTGASRGLGKAIAVGLARAGASVAVAARTEAVWDERQPGTIFETVEEIERAGGRAICVPTDVAKEEDLERLVEATRAAFGPIDILVNNAAVTVGGRPPPPGETKRTAPASAAPAIRFEEPISLLSFPLKALRLHFAVNVFAAYRLMQLVLPDMLATHRGSIINVSSDAALKPGEGPYRNPGIAPLFAYGSTKLALHNLTQAVAVEFAPRGIAANVLIPSMPIPTPGSVSLLAAYDLKQWASAESFAAAAVTLATLKPEQCTGRILFHQDVNHPELGRRGFLSTEFAPS